MEEKQFISQQEEGCIAKPHLKEKTNENGKHTDASTVTLSKLNFIFQLFFNKHILSTAKTKIYIGDKN